jgi:hypothetical protein
LLGLHRDKGTYVSMLPRDMASCMLGPMLNPWLDAIEAHVAARCPHALHIGGGGTETCMHIDSAGDIALGCMSELTEGYYSTALGRTVRATTNSSCTGDWGPWRCIDSNPAARISSPRWAVDADAWSAIASLIQWTRVRALIPPSGFLCCAVEATDGKGMCAVSVCSTPDTGFITWTTIVCTPTTAFAVDIHTECRVAALAFDPCDGSLLMLVEERSLLEGPGPYGWRLHLVRPGPAPAPQ